MKKTVYFDNAATTFPKPECVYRHAENFTRSMAGNPGRGSHKMSLSAANEVYRARCAIAELFGASPERVAFTVNTTSALNTVINAVIKDGCHIIISSMEHNSVLRPVANLCGKRGGSYSIFNVGKTDAETVYNIKKLITPNTAAVICTHMSNIVPVILPIRKIGDLCHKNRIRFIVDGAQSAGLLPIDMTSDNIDILAVPGHKGLYGYQGSGAVIFGEDIGEDLEPMMYGGSGTDSVPLEMPSYLPDRFEAGTLPAPAISSLGAGALWVKSRGVKSIYEHDKMLSGYIIDRIKDIPGVIIYSENRGATLLFNIGSLPASRAASIYDENGICVRSGLHCAPLAHKTVGTFPYGAIRASFGAFNTVAEASIFCSVTKMIAESERQTANNPPFHRK